MSQILRECPLGFLLSFFHSANYGFESWQKQSTLTLSFKACHLAYANSFHNALLFGISTKQSPFQICTHNKKLESYE